MTAIRTSSPPRPARLPSPPASQAPVAIDGVRQLLVGLDRQQRLAVTHGDGPLLVVAGPGTGKTEVITRRVAWLITSRRARPSEILALTFTERAADEMQARVDVLVPYGQADTAIHTFHAFGDRLLREHGHAIGRPDDPRVIGRSQAVALLRDHIFELGLDRYRPLGDPTRFVGALVDLFGRAKQEGVSPGDLAAYATSLEAGARSALDATATDGAREAVAGLLDEAAAQAEVARAYEGYQRLLMERGLVDHGDQVAEAVRLLEDRPAVQMALRRRFRHLVVDEAQDADPQQLRLVRLLAGASGNVAFVGDDDQAIYGFRGAVGQGLSDLDAHFQPLREVVLRRNYRSRRPILEAARRLIRHNDPHRLEVTHGLDKSLTAVRRARRPALVQHRGYGNATEEADAVAEEIGRRLAGGSSPRSIAILVRTNAEAGPLLASLDVRGIPRRFSGASGLLGQREVRDVLSLLGVMAAPSSSDDLYAVMTSAAYGLGGEDLTAICDLARRRRRSLWSVVTELLEQPGLLRISNSTRDRLAVLVASLRRSISDAHERPAPEVLYDHLRESGWLKLLVARAERGDDAPLRRVARLFEMVREQADLLTDARVQVVVPVLRGLVEAGHETSSTDRDEQDAVSVLTVHQSKGLEFSIVYVVGVAEGRFPVRARRDVLTLPAALTGRTEADDEDANVAEERRLFYVAMTRARDELLLSHASAGARGGRRRRPSTFLSEALGRPVDDADPSVSAVTLDVPATTAQPQPGPGRSSPSSEPLMLSYSQIDDYLTCPLKYRLRHRVHVPTPPHHALVFGNALHQAVAVANLARLRGRVIQPEMVEQTLAAHWQSEGFISQEHEAARYAAGQDALTRFVGRAGTATDTIVAVEQPFSIRIDGDSVRGRYDVVRREQEGPLVITDYKSGDVREPHRARQRARSSLQLQLYALAWEAEHGAPPDAVELHFLEGDVIGRVSYTEAQLAKAREKVATAASGIRAEHFEATPGYPACDWCPFRRICPSAA